MNTKHLSLFREVIKTRNITQVAHNLHVSQPAISMQLKRLEQEMGVPLFTVVGRNISVTDAGLTFLEYAEAMLSLEEQIYRAMEEFRTGNRGRIVVGASPVIGTYLLPKFILSFSQAHPDIHLEVRTGSDGETEKAVQMGSVDIGITLQEPEDHLSFRITKFVHDRLVGIQAPGVADSGRVIIPEDMETPMDENLKLDILKLHSTEAVKRYVMEGMGYGIVLESAAATEIQSEKLLAWSGYKPYPIIINVITRPAERLSKSIWYFLDHLRK